MSILIMEQNNSSLTPLPDLQEGSLESLIRTFSLKMNAKRVQLLTQHGIVESDIEVLRYLANHEVKKMKELGDLFGLKFSTLTSTVDRLEDNRLVKRKGSKDDRRVVFVMIAPRGKNFLNDLNSLYADVAVSIKQHIEGDPCNALMSALDTVNQAL